MRRGIPQTERGDGVSVIKKVASAFTADDQVASAFTADEDAVIVVDI